MQAQYAGLLAFANKRCARGWATFRLEKGQAPQTVPSHVTSLRMEHVKLSGCSFPRLMHLHIYSEYDEEDEVTDTFVSSILTAAPNLRSVWLNGSHSTGALQRLLAAPGLQAAVLEGLSCQEYRERTIRTTALPLVDVSSPTLRLLAVLACKVR